MMSYYTAAAVTDTCRKRRADDADIEHFFKKRLLDNFENLKIFEGSKSATSATVGDLKPEKADPNTVYIDSIDHFLESNQERGDVEAKTIDSIDDTKTMREIVIPNGLLKPLNEVFNDAHQGSSDNFLKYKQHEMVDRVMSRKRQAQAKATAGIDREALELDAMLDEGEEWREPEIEVTNEELYYETYLARYWSLIKYYNPDVLVMKAVQRWYLQNKGHLFIPSWNLRQHSSSLHRLFKSDQIQELDDDGEDMMMEDESYYPSSADSTRTSGVRPSFQHTADYVTSTPSPSQVENSYGNYYGGDDMRDDAVQDNAYFFETQTAEAAVPEPPRAAPYTPSENVNLYGSFYEAPASHGPATTPGYSNGNGPYFNDDNDDEMEFD